MHEIMLTRKLKALASAGGKARAAKLTPEQRIDIAVKAASARWANTKEKEKHELSSSSSSLV